MSLQVEYQSEMELLSQREDVRNHKIDFKIFRRQIIGII